MNHSMDNVFIPTSGTNVALIKLLPQLIVTSRDNPDYRMQLFGYPEWQTYTKDHLEAFFELDTYFYSSFYTNNLLPAAINFTKSYRKWYGKEMDERYPKFGMLVSTRATSSSKDCRATVRDLKRTWTKWTLFPFRPASSSSV